MTDTADSINIAEVASAIRRGWRPLLVSIVLGALAGLAVLLFGPRHFTGTASLVVRSSSPGGAASVLSKLGVGEGMAGLASSSPLETEVAILSSRALVAQVVDSLELQASVTSPKSIAARNVFSVVHLGGAFPVVRYTAERDSSGTYRVSTGGTSVSVVAGRPIVLPQGTLELRADTTLPPRFTFVLADQEDAVTDAVKHLSVSKATAGEVITIAFQAPDSSTSAAVPNALIANYLVRRHTVDRSTNEYRVAFIGAQLDSVGRQLSLAEDSLRRFEEATGVLDPQVQGKIQLDQAAEIRKGIGDIDVERGAIVELSSQISSGQMQPRQLAAFPTFLKSPAINELIGQLSTVETARTELLEKRLPNDGEVMAMAQSAKDIEGQLTGLASSYKTSLDKQRSALASQLDTISHLLGTFPGAAESSGRLQRQAKELAVTDAALQTQLVESRLAAVAEGGDVRVLDAAHPPRRVAFPRVSTTVGIGAGIGLFVGVILALLTGLMGRYVEDPLVIERTAGVPALQADSGVPLLVAGPQLTKTVLLVPIDGRASTAGVAERLARTAVARAINPTVLDLSGKAAASMALTTDINATIRRLEEAHELVIVRLPGLAADETAAALSPDRSVLLIASPGRVERRVLLGTMQTLRRLAVPCAGVVLNRASDVVVV
ncbi:MAG TPA: Wzz/FepE/Etk N-terminal domain-containing protein [Gemmatimonadaceae bacterium]|jgi:uncharacterized protein involved in exopolysaccharide biosynthesis